MDAQCCGYTKKTLKFTLYWMNCVNKAVLVFLLLLADIGEQKVGRPYKVPMDIKVFQENRRWGKGNSLQRSTEKLCVKQEAQCGFFKGDLTLLHAPKNIPQKTPGGHLSLSFSERSGFNQPGASLFIKNFPVVLAHSQSWVPLFGKRASYIAWIQWGGKLGETEPAFIRLCIMSLLSIPSHLPRSYPNPCVWLWLVVCGHPQPHHLMVCTNNAEMFTQTQISEPTCLSISSFTIDRQSSKNFSMIPKKKKKKKSTQRGGCLCSKFKILWALIERLSRWHPVDPLPCPTLVTAWG